RRDRECSGRCTGAVRREGHANTADPGNRARSGRSTPRVSRGAERVAVARGGRGRAGWWVLRLRALSGGGFAPSRPPMSASHPPPGARPPSRVCRQSLIPSVMTSSHYLDRLARLARRIRFDDLSDSAVTAAKAVVLDT